MKLCGMRQQIIATKAQSLNPSVDGHKGSKKLKFLTHRIVLSEADTSRRKIGTSGLKTGTVYKRIFIFVYVYSITLREND